MRLFIALPARDGDPAPLLFAIAILSTACGGDPPPADLDTPIENDESGSISTSIRREHRG
jgi:hypothetical protein